MITVKYFASLKDQVGRAEQQIDAAEISTALDAWKYSSGQQILPENVLIAINHAYASSDSAVKSGDEVAFFPPVTGG